MSILESLGNPGYVLALMLCCFWFRIRNKRCGNGCPWGMEEMFSAK